MWVDPGAADLHVLVKCRDGWVAEKATVIAKLKSKVNCRKGKEEHFMKINNITITNAEALNLSKAINYAIRVHGTIDVEVYTLYASHDRDVNIIVHTQDGWDKAFNLTTGAVTNIVEEDTGDTDGNHGASILDRLENVMDRIEAINHLLDRYEHLMESFDKLL